MSTPSNSSKKVYRCHRVTVTGDVLGADRTHLGQYDVFVAAGQSDSSSAGTAVSFLEDRLHIVHPETTRLVFQTPVGDPAVLMSDGFNPPTAAPGPYAHTRRVSAPHGVSLTDDEMLAALGTVKL